MLYFAILSYPYRTMRCFPIGSPFGLLLLLLMAAVSPARAAAATEKYPQEALRCYSSSAANGETICPVDRNSYCIKEESTTSRGECGTVDPYRFDIWDRRLGRCIYRKCAASCLNDTVAMFGDAQQYSRTTYCCSSNRCNGAMDTVSQSTLAITLSMGVLAYLMR